MRRPLVAILRPPAPSDDAPLARILAVARDALADHHRGMFERAGARVWQPDAAMGGATGGLRALLSRLADEVGPGEGLVVLGGGAVPLLRPADARRLVSLAGSGVAEGLTNNWFSSDVLAIGRADLLRDLPPIATDNGLPRILSASGVAVRELPGRDRLAIDLDTPGDLALLRLIPSAPAVLRAMAAREAIELPRLDALRAVAAEARAELLVAGRSGSRTLGWLERHVPARTRFLAEERGLRAASGNRRPPRTTLGRLLDARGPEALGAIVAELADAAILDTRVLLADRLGPAEGSWPSPEDRFSSDLLRTEGIRDAWLAALTRSASDAPVPILLGAHTLVGPGIRWLLAR